MSTAKAGSSTLRAQVDAGLVFSLSPPKRGEGWGEGI